MKPNASSNNPEPAYLCGLFELAGLSQREAAKFIGISDRLMRYYLTDSESNYRVAPYAVQ